MWLCVRESPSAKMRKVRNCVLYKAESSSNHTDLSQYFRSCPASVANATANSSPPSTVLHRPGGAPGGVPRVQDYSTTKSA